MHCENYITVTPCRNEEDNLKRLAESMIHQTLKPSLWVILDDGSTDNTPNILNELKIKYNWIEVISGVKSKRDLGFHYAEIVDNAIKYAMLICNRSNIHFDLIGLIDADMILNSDFFEKISTRFEDNSKLGVASGSVAYQNENGMFFEKGRDNLPIGGLRVWRKDCFIETGGFPKSYSADAVSNVLAALAGWDTKKYADIIGVQTRQTSSAEGLWRGYSTRGESDYYRDYHPIYVFFKSIKYLFTRPFYIGIAYACAYIKSALNRKEKIKISEVRKYYRNKHIEIIRYYIYKIKSECDEFTYT